MFQNPQTRSKIEASLIRKAWADGELKKRLETNPTATYAAEVAGAGEPFPPGSEVHLLEETGKVIYLVIPQVEIDPKTEVKLTERSTRADFEAALILRAKRDDAFKHWLLANPKAAYEEHLATVREAAKLPEDMVVKAFEEVGNVIYFRLPQAPPQGGELSEAELEKVAGGVVAVGVAIVSTVTVGAVAAAVLLAEPYYPTGP